MASSRAVSPRASRLSWLARIGVTAGAVASVTAIPLGAGSAQAQPTAHSIAPLALSITQTSQPYATPGETITITGKIKNRTHHVLTGLSVQLLASATPFGALSDLENFASGQLSVSPSPVSGVHRARIAKLKKGQSEFWSLTVPVKDLNLSCFGVYPLTVQAGDATGTAQASDPLPLPFWPSKARSCADQIRPKPFTASWIWPLIDSPHQGPCPGLLNNFLSSSIATGGRLSNLLSVGRTYASSAHLTWAIDPALLDNVTTMRRSYRVGDSANCSRNRVHPANRDATSWLSSLTSATAGQQVFATPYADVDLAGLAQFGNNADLGKSFSDGQEVASRILHRASKTALLPAGPKQLSSVVWPADGRANLALLETLGAMKIGAVILAMPPTQRSPTPGAVTSAFDGVGTTLKVLLANNSLTDLLGSPAAKSRQAGQIFSVSQLFEAETAMIVAQAPAMQRPILVAPPRRWDPSRSLATSLLDESANAPWLRPSTLNQLAAGHSEHAFRSVTRPYSKARPTAKLLRQVGSLDHRVSLLQSIRITKDLRLDRTMFGIESSRWSGSGLPLAKARLARMKTYVDNQFAGLSMSGQLKGGQSPVIHVTLGGKVGTVPVSIHNSLSYAVKVGLRVSSDNETVTATQKNPHELYLVAPFTSTQVKLFISAAQTGKATVTLSLRSRTGKLLPNPPDKPLTLALSATNLGTVALVIFAAALAVFVIASAAQALRRGRPNGSDPAAAAASAGPESPSGGTAAGASAVPEADVAGTAVPENEGQREAPAAPDRPDNVFGDRSELSPAGPAPGHRPTEETR
ncbi:MAG TPA: DUF6049 family protein [Streptosporangiaceae bacterium]|nr:DUF6049 family protein [Streptosporangiaceae bacterium]